MAIFHFTGMDRAGGLALRVQVRPEHLAYANGGGHVRLGGALLDTEGHPCGSVMVIEADDLAHAQRLMANDPYAVAGLFQTTTLFPWRIAIGGLAEPAP